MRVGALAAAAALVTSTTAGAGQATQGARVFKAIEGPKGNWHVDVSDEGEGDYCFMNRDYQPSGNARAFLEVRYSSGSAPVSSMLIWNSELTAEGDAPVEIWFDRQGDKAADGRGTAHVKSDEEGPYVVIGIDKSFIARIATASTLTARLAGGAPVSYSIAPAKEAVVDLFKCAWAIK